MRLYIADDNADFAEFCAEVATLEGWDVICCSNGADLLERVQEETGPALLLIDILMPVMDGIEVIKALGKVGREMRIRFITGGPEASAQAAQLIADSRSFDVGSILRKPLALQDLRDILRREIDREDSIFQKPAET